MIQGHIDLISPNRIEGWMHSDLVPMAGMRLFAFVNQDCVGEGSIDVFRGDLLEAQIGDGMAGFSFSIYLQPKHDTRLIEIRLAGSSLVLRQANIPVAALDDSVTEQRRSPRDPHSLSWMLGRGWLTHEHYELLRFVGEFGAYLQCLELAVDDGETVGRQHKIAEVAAPVLQLHLSMDVKTQAHEEIWGEHLPELREHLHAQFPHTAPVVALWSPSINCVRIQEGTHLGATAGAPCVGVDYEFGDGHLLWINLDTSFEIPTGGLSCPLTAYVPLRAQAEAVAATASG